MRDGLFSKVSHKFLFGILLAMVLSTLSAEPTPSVRYLMQTPLSAFDYGLYRLEQRFDIPDRIYMPVNRPGRMAAVANYDHSRDRILIAANVFVSTTAMASDDARAICRFAVADARFYGGIDPVSGTRLPSEIRSLAMFFESPSTPRSDQPTNFENELLSIVDFRVAVYSSHPRTGQVRKHVECAAPLLGTEIRFVD